MQKARWYVIHVYSGSEKKVAEAILEQADKKELKDFILEVLVPTEEIVEVKRGSRISSEKNFFPGYVLVKMIMTDESWHLVRNTAKVTTFLGGKGKPSPISEAEVKRIVNQVEERQAKPALTIYFDVGEQLRVSDGPFTSFTGTVEEVDYEKERLKVSVMIFGRPTPVDLGFNQVEKI